MVNPLISVIIPVYNTEKYIEKCILSVLSQTIKNIEIILVDDCGKDSAIDIAHSISKQDERIKMINYGSNKGVSYARNQGIDASNGEFLFFLDSDDWLPQNALSLLFDGISLWQGDLVFGKMAVEKNGTLSPVAYIETYLEKLIQLLPLYDNNAKKIPVQYFYTGSVCHCLCRASVIKNNHLRFIEGVSWEDVPFGMGMWYYAKHISVIPHFVYFRTIREEKDNLSQTQTVKAKSFIDRDIILDTLFDSVMLNKGDIYYVALVKELMGRMLYTTNQMRKNMPLHSSDFDSDQWFTKHETKYSKYALEIERLLVGG
ncbi:MAG: glycosyltransferase family 2 protein [Clostridiales bacterium]|nr:glycosyltransferase family 2 protein [Clostridiales bacterium]